MIRMVDKIEPVSVTMLVTLKENRTAFTSGKELKGSCQQRHEI